MPHEDLADLELDKSFRLLRKIGEGGMGCVYEAEQFSLNRKVAVKIVAGRGGDRQLKERFQKEMKLAGEVKHKNLVPIIDAGFDQNYLYIAMELVEGLDLARILKDGPLDLDRALRLTGDIAGALQCLHDDNFVHRDVKPANILVAEVGKATEYARLGDFGIAKATDEPAGITKGIPPGTLGYMAPENFKTWSAGPAADQYSLACVLFEMLAGRPPFDPADPDITDLTLEAEPPDIATIVVGVPESIRTALQRALAKTPEERYPSVLEFFEAARGEMNAELEKGDGATPLRLTPVEVSRALFGLAPDRDERASQLAMETYLTLWANDYTYPMGRPKSPKRRNGALRSLVIGENFLEGFKEDGAEGRRAESACAELAAGRDFLGSDGIGLAQKALRALIDHRTLQGSNGATLLEPFHESLLWYDARRSGAKRPWSVRKVNMRGTGVTLAAMLLRDGSSDGSAVHGIREALQAPSPLQELVRRLSDAVPEMDGFALERDEEAAWEAAERDVLAPLAERVNRHCRNISAQAQVSPATKLLQIRLVLALDLAHHALTRSWDAIEAPDRNRFLLLCFAPDERKENEVRIASEVSLQSARQQITQAIITQIQRRAEQIAQEEPDADWDAKFEKRAKLDAIATRFESASEPADFQELAGLVFEESRGSGYGRPVDAFRVLLESVGLIHGSGQYRYLRAGPDMLAALVGAVGGTPMPMSRYLAAIWREWNFLVGDREMTQTVLVESLDGSLLARNARILEQVLSSSGLAIALSDQTCMVGPNLGAFK